MAGILTLEPLVVWTEPSDADLRGAMALAGRLVCDPALGLGGPLRTLLSGHAGLALGSGRVWLPGVGSRAPLGGMFYGNGISTIGRRASQLGHAAPARSIIIDDWTRARLEGVLPGLDVGPVQIGPRQAGWLIPPASARLLQDMGRPLS